MLLVCVTPPCLSLTPSSGSRRCCLCVLFVGLPLLPPRGLRPDYELTGDMRKTDVMAKFIGHQLNSRGLLNKANHFFFQVCVVGNSLVYKAPHGCFELVSELLDDAKERSAEAFFQWLLSSSVVFSSASGWARITRSLQSLFFLQS